MRIADLLLIQDDDDDDDDKYFISRSRSILHCWIFPSKRSKIAPSKSEPQSIRQTNNEEQVFDQSVSLDPKKKSVTTESTSATETVDSSGRHIKDTAFSLGLGVGLVFLTALTRNEVDRMTELKTQMEMLIKQVKDEMQNTDVLSMPSASNDILISPTINSSRVGNKNGHCTNENCLSSHHLELEDTNVTIKCDSYLKCDTLRKNDCIQGIEQLEAELEAELEHLQLNLDAENLLQHPQLHWRESTGSNESLSASSGEIDHPQEPYGGELDNGVCPIELERRLHELLEARQQEQIQDLESALECAMNELRQKEMEVSWWKDIAQQNLQHVEDIIHS